MKPSTSLPPIEDAADLLAEETAPPWCKLDRRTRTLSLGADEGYRLDLATIASEADLLSWALHLCEKNWMDTERLHEVVSVVAGYKGFLIEGVPAARFGPPSEVTQDWPRLTLNPGPGEVREWVHPVPPRFYLFQPQTGEFAGRWSVVDRVFDLAATSYYVRKADYLRAFVRQHDPRERNR